MHVFLAECRVIEAIDLERYVKAYQNMLLGASQCYRHSYGRGVGHIPSSMYPCPHALYPV